MGRLPYIIPAMFCLLIVPSRLSAQTLKYPPIPDNIDADVRRELEILGNPNTHGSKAEAAAIALGNMGPKASAAVPILIETLQLNWYGGMSTSISSITSTPGGTYTGTTFGAGATPGAAAGAALVKIGEAAIDPLIAALDDPRVDIRRRSAQVLGMIKAARAANPLVLLLKREQAEEAKRLAAAKPDLRRPTRNNTERPKDDYEELRVTVVEALNEIKDPRSVTGFIIGLGDHGYFVVNKAMDFLLKRGKDVADNLTDALKDENWQIRMNICKILAYIDDPRVVEPLIVALDKDDDYRVRQQAVIALARLKATQCSDVFCTHLKDPDFHVRRELAKQLGEMKDDRAVAPLTQLINREKAYLKNLARREAELKKRHGTYNIEAEVGTAEADAIKSLGQIGNDQAVSALIAMLSDKKNDYGSRVAQALGETRNPKAVPALIKAAPSYSLSAADALRQIGTDQAKDAAITAYARILHPPKGPPDIYSQKQAIQGLGAIGTPKAVQLIAETSAQPELKIEAERALYNLSKTDVAKRLSNPDEEIRAGAALSIGFYGGPKAAELLIPLLNDKSTVVQSRAAEALGRLKNPSAVGPLMELLDTKDSIVLTTTCDSLKKITGQDFHLDKEKWREWWRSNKEKVTNKGQDNSK